MKKKYSHRATFYNDKWRVRIVLAILLSVALILVGRILQLTVLDRSFLQKQSNARVQRLNPIPAHRGMIVDRNHYPLAISTPVYSVWVAPQQFSLLDPHIPELATLLNETIKNMQTHMESQSKRGFVYLKRQLPPATANKIKDLAIPGLHLQREYHRFYPDAEVTAQLIGFTNVDDQGQEGLELAYNSWMQGLPGKEKVLKDLYGHVVATEGVVTPAKPGQDLVLSIDHRIQYLAYSALEQGIKENEAESGSVVVMDVKTGEVLAMANAPSFNPNIRPKTRGNNYRNLAVTDVFEPGSTMKAFSVANALQSGKYKPSTLVDTSPGWMYLNGHRVEDEHGSLGIIDVTTILQHSSNMGVTKLTLSLPPNSLWDLLNKIGFGQSTQSGFPGEVNGVLPKRQKWSDIVLATMSFGYGVSATTLQLAQAYAMLADQGIQHPVSLVKLDKPPANKPILTAKITTDSLMMMQSVVGKGGTATAAQIPGYKVAGKTGTARMLGPHGYDKHRHIAIFAGVAPATNPRLVVVVMIKDPKAKYYAGFVAAPVFAKVMAGALRELNIAPDDISSLQPEKIEPTKQGRPV